jgi:trigger factor
VKSTVEALEGNKVKVYVELDDSELDAAIGEAFRKIAAEARIPGFRPGKAPRKVLEARLGKDVGRGQALQDAIPHYYSLAVIEHEVDVIDRPDFDITDGEHEGTVAFEATVAVRPRVAVQGYGALKVTVPNLIPTDAEVQEQIDRLLDSHATWSPVERAAEDGDRVLIDIEGIVDGEPAPGLTASDYSYVVGSGGVVPELDEHLRGASAGDELVFDAVYPDEPERDLSFRATVGEVLGKVLPELDDAFVDEATEVSTVAELRDDLLARGTRLRRYRAMSALHERVGSSLAGLVELDLPEALIDAQFREGVREMQMRLQAQGLTIETWMAMQGRPPEEILDEMRASARSGAKLDLALRAVAEQEGIAVTDDDLAVEWRNVSERVGVDADEVARQFENAGQLQAVRSDLLKRKAFDWVLERVEVVDDDGKPVDRAALRDTTEGDDTEGDGTHDDDDVDADGGPHDSAGDSQGDPE